MSFAIEIISLSKKYIIPRTILFLLPKKITTACDQISLQIERGEMFCLLGPNGAGKTTLIKMLCTLILPDSGKAYVNGFDILKNVMEVKNSIGLVTSEERSFYWRLTGRENLMFFGALSNLSRKQVNKRIDELDSLLGVKSYIDDLIGDYSSGMRQKLAVIRGLLNDPEILFLDEPTHSLDHHSSFSLLQFIKNKFVTQDKKTVFYCTHQLWAAEEFADRIAFLNKGKIQFDAKMSQIKQQGIDLRQMYEQKDA
ncbi:MAG: ABC transporter ATP-binding protein [Candidatus Omnitrophota bacterium]